MYVVLGGGTLGLNVARLVSNRDKTVIIDRDSKRVETLKEEGMAAFVGDASKIDLMKNKFSGKDIFLIMTPEPEANLNALNKLRGIFPNAYIAVKASDLASAKKMKEAKANYVIQTPDILTSSVVMDIEKYETRKSAATLLSILKEAKKTGVGIVVHNSPDPDALASALALKKICDEYKIKSKIIYGGEISRHENRAFVNLIGIELTKITEVDYLLPMLNDFEKIALVDSPKPGANNVLPKDIIPNIIIDHHPLDEKVKADYSNIKGIGATSTIMTKYLQQFEISIDSSLATALLYGIRTDTKNFTRDITPEDLAAVAFLSPLSDKEMLTKIETPPITPEAMDVMGKAILNREIYAPYLISCVGAIKDRDNLSIPAEFLLSTEGVSTVIVFGIFNDQIMISARTNDVRLNLGDVLSKAFGSKAVVLSKNGALQASAGGHSSSAGAQIPLGLLGETEDTDALINIAKSAVKKQFFEAVGLKEKEKKH